MNTKLKYSIILSSLFGIISICALLLLLIVFNNIKADPSKFIPQNEGDAFGYSIFTGFIIIVIFHFLSFISLLLQLFHNRSKIVWSIITFIVGILSFILIFGDYTMVNEIAKEQRLGWETREEWNILTIFLIFHIIYALIFISEILLSSKAAKNMEDNILFGKENLFYTGQIIGIICGILGLLINISFIGKEFRENNIVKFVPVYLYILAPYIITMSIWALLNIKKSFLNWFDEKQWHNMNKAGLVTLILSIPGLFVILFIKYPLHSFWFPHYLFTILILFSLSTVVLFKKY